MGSLPNLHELARGKLDSPAVHRHHAPVSSFGTTVKLISGQPAPLGQTNRRSRSSGHHHALWMHESDAILEHMTTYSPISCRSARASAISCRRRESMTSSAGTSSVRRLIAAVRTTPSGPRPPRKVILRHCAALLLGHMSISAATLPIFPLQAGLGAFNPHLGPLVLALLYATATLSACFALIVVQKIGTNLIISIGHLVTTIFVGSHLFPRWYFLLPSYVLFGIFVTPTCIARTAHVNVTANNLSIVTDNTDPEDPDDSRRDCFLRRLIRGMRLAEDMGLAFGCIVVTVIVKIMDSPEVVGYNAQSNIEVVCGAEYCPQETYLYNETLIQPTMPINTAKIVASLFLGLAILAFGISCAFLDSRMKESRTALETITLFTHLKSIKQSFQDPKLQLAAPLSLFIGFEQGFIIGDFTEAYVVCALGGALTVALSSLSFALLQGIAGVTLSMLLRHIRRYFVVAVGFAFHACLLLALLSWRPAGDDPALFNVISAAWGVCNAIWETLIYTLLLGLYPTSWQGPLSTSLFWKWLGLFLALGLHGLVCIHIRLLVLAGTLLLSVIPYTWLEIRLAKRGKCLAPL